MGRRSTVSLSSFAERVAKVFREKASGTQADRRQLLRLLKAVARGDVVIVTRIDRAARSTFDLFAIVKQILAAGGQFSSLAGPLADTAASTGRLMIAVLGGLTDMKCDLIRTRTGPLKREAPMTQRVPADHVRLKRVYLPAGPEDGVRVLVDRLWPRGVSKARAALAFWNKDVPPTTELRQWFGHDPARWTEFCKRYRTELRAKPEAVEALGALARQGRVTLVFGARDEAHNEAVVLREVLLGR